MVAPEDVNDRSRRLWDRYAPRYDRQIRLFERLMLKDGRSWVCSRASGDVLEVAIGTGLNLPCYPKSVHLTGLELSPAMLAIARRRARDLGIGADLREGTAEALPFNDASFDTVVCTLSLCIIPRDRAAIAEMFRVLRPGGRLILLDHVASGNAVILAGQWLLEKLTRWHTGDYQTRRPLPLVDRAGFTIEQAERLKAGTIERLTAVKPVAADPFPRSS